MMLRPAHSHHACRLYTRGKMHAHRTAPHESRKEERRDGNDEQGGPTRGEMQLLAGSNNSAGPSQASRSRGTPRVRDCGQDVRELVCTGQAHRPDHVVPLVVHFADVRRCANERVGPRSTAGPSVLVGGGGEVASTGEGGEYITMPDHAIMTIQLQYRSRGTWKRC